MRSPLIGPCFAPTVFVGERRKTRVGRGHSLNITVRPRRTSLEETGGCGYWLLKPPLDVVGVLAVVPLECTVSFS